MLMPCMKAFIFVQLKCMGITPYFWRTKADAEMDFITDYEGELIPIEVKSADNTRAKSLHLFCGRYEPKMAFKSSLKNVGDNLDGKTHVWSLPLYAFYRFREYLEEHKVLYLVLIVELADIVLVGLTLVITLITRLLLNMNKILMLI